MTNARIRGIETESFIDIICWMREYCRLFPIKHSFDKRFAIGVYQIHQIMGYGIEIGRIEYEPLAAACLHFIGVAEMLDLDLETFFSNTDIRAIKKTHRGTDDISYSGWDYVLYNVSKAQQMIFYRSLIYKGIKRKKRYSKTLLVICLANLIMFFMDRIPVDKRKQAFYLAMETMCGSL